MTTAINTAARGAEQQRSEADARFDRRMKLVQEAFDLHHVYLQHYLFGLTRHWQDAENLMQDLWRHVLLHFPEPQICQLGILRRKTYQVFVDHYRSRVRRGEIVTDEVPERDSSGQWSEAYSEEEEARLKERFWADFPGIELSAAQKEALWFKARFEFTYEEIAERLGVPKSTVGDWILFARKILKEHLNA